MGSKKEEGFNSHNLAVESRVVVVLVDSTPFVLIPRWCNGSIRVFETYGPGSSPGWGAMAVKVTTGKRTCQQHANGSLV